MRNSVKGWTAVASLVAVTAGGVSCASLGRRVFEEPVVSFREVRVNGIGLQGGSLDVVLNVYNPNGFKLDATRLTYRLLVGDSVALGQGALDSRFTVEENDSTSVRLPIDFTYAGLGAATSQLMRSGSVPYRVVGDVTVTTPIGNFTRPFDRTGRFSAFSGAR